MRLRLLFGLERLCYGGCSSFGSFEALRARLTPYYSFLSRFSLELEREDPRSSKASPFLNLNDFDLHFAVATPHNSAILIFCEAFKKKKVLWPAPTSPLNGYVT
jgi:hypothetical protein